MILISNTVNMLLEHTKLIIDPILKLKKQMKEKGFPIIYINDHYDLWQADFDKIIDTCKNEGNASLIERIKPQQGRVLSHQTEAFRILWDGPQYTA